MTLVFGKKRYRVTLVTLVTLLFLSYLGRERYIDYMELEQNKQQYFAPIVMSPNVTNVPAIGFLNFKCHLYLNKCPCYRF